MRVLVVEDDPEISRFIVRGLTEERHLVDLVADGVSAIDMVAAEEYDAVVLDLMLPGVDGFEVCRRMRAQGADTPVIIVTARDGLADRVAGLDGGADDYLVKPFAFEELLARLRALGRRGRTRHMTHLLEYGPVAVDPVAHTVAVSGQLISLTATEYRLLEFLSGARRPSSRATSWRSTCGAGITNRCRTTPTSTSATSVANCWRPHPGP